MGEKLSKFAFVILNYAATEETIACVNAINRLSYKEKYIIVVDNYSEDYKCFFQKLRTEFNDIKNIVYIETGENLGYARGNNVGIYYARKVIDASFVCVINPDAVIVSENFIEKAISLYQEDGYAILGPRILQNEMDVNPLGGYHESVFRCIKSWVSNNRIYWIKRIKSYGITNPLKEIHKHYESPREVDNQYRENIKVEEKIILEKNMGKQLSGACLIMSPIFLDNFDGFCDETFLYCEEAILACVLFNLGYRMEYSSQLVVKHEGERSLVNKVGNEEKQIMMKAKVGAVSCMVAAHVFAKKKNRKRLGDVLRGECAPYTLIKQNDIFPQESI